MSALRFAVPWIGVVTGLMGLQTVSMLRHGNVSASTASASGAAFPASAAPARPPLELRPLVVRESSGGHVRVDFKAAAPEFPDRTELVLAFRLESDGGGRSEVSISPYVQRQGELIEPAWLAPTGDLRVRLQGGETVRDVRIPISPCFARGDLRYLRLFFDPVGRVRFDPRTIRIEPKEPLVAAEPSVSPVIAAVLP